MRLDHNLIRPGPGTPRLIEGGGALGVIIPLSTRHQGRVRGVTVTVDMDVQFHRTKNRHRKRKGKSKTREKAY